MLPGCLDQPRTTVYCLVADRNVYLSRYSLLTCFLLQAFNRWGYYPLILIGSWAFATINRVHDFANPGHKIFWLSILDVGFAGLMVSIFILDASYPVLMSFHNILKLL